jgi:hypothetical protein
MDKIEPVPKPNPDNTDTKLGGCPAQRTTEQKPAPEVIANPTCPTGTKLLQLPFLGSKVIGNKY